MNHFQSLIALLDSQESSLLTKGLSFDTTPEDLESLLNSLDALLETANELFNKVG